MPPKIFKNLLNNLSHFDIKVSATADSSTVAIVVAAFRFTTPECSDWRLNFAWNTKFSWWIFEQTNNFESESWTHLFQFPLILLMRIKRYDFNARCVTDGSQKNRSVFSVIQRDKCTDIVYPANENGSIFTEMMHDIGLLPVVGKMNVENVVTIRFSCNDVENRKTMPLTINFINNLRIYFAKFKSYINNNEHSGRPFDFIFETYVRFPLSWYRRYPTNASRKFCEKFI